MEGKNTAWESSKHFSSNKALFIKWQHLKPLNRTELPNDRIDPYLIAFAWFSSTLVYLSSSGLKLSTAWHTWKIATCYVYYKVPPHMRFVSKLNLTFQIVNPSDVRHMSMMAHLARKNTLHTLAKESLLVIPRIKDLLGICALKMVHLCFPPCQVQWHCCGCCHRDSWLGAEITWLQLYIWFACISCLAYHTWFHLCFSSRRLTTSTVRIGGHFQAEGEDQFLYSSNWHLINQLWLPPSRLNTSKQNWLWLPPIQTSSWTSHSYLLQ